MNFSETSDAIHAPSEPDFEHKEEGVSPADSIESRTREAPKWSAAFEEFFAKLGGLPSVEEKIVLGLAFMRDAISQEGSPRFREFWESRRLVLPLFKENVNVAVRSKFWNEYVELTVEARRLKEILEEQSSFAMEQIDLAIQAIEKDLSQFQGILADSEEVDFRGAPRWMSEKASFYLGLQRELNLLNTLASRLNGLRKEIMKTDMRVRFKTKFFKRLSELGDSIFPRRKGLIEQVSAEFEKDVAAFVAEYFHGNEIVGAPYYALREEIKAFQWVAKVLTLGSAVFSRSRVVMSECWDKVKLVEKEHKKVLLEKKQASSGVAQAIAAKVEDLKAQSAEMSLRDLDREIDEILGEMRAVYLDRDDLRMLRDALAQVRAPHIAEQERKAQELETAEKEKLRLKKERVQQVKEKIASAAAQGSQSDLDSLVAQLKSLESEISALDTSKIEKQQIERLLRPIKDLIAEKKESSLMNLSDDDRKTLENYQLVIQQKKERRQEIRELIDSYRKTLGSSNLDFEKAFQLRESIDVERERLEKVNASIEEIEQKISQLER